MWVNNGMGARKIFSMGGQWSELWMTVVATERPEAQNTERSLSARNSNGQRDEETYHDFWLGKGISLLSSWMHWLYLPYKVWRSKNPVSAAVMLFFIDFHQGPPRTIWQGPRRPLHKWPLLKSAPPCNFSERAKERGGIASSCLNVVTALVRCYVITIQCPKHVTKMAVTPFDPLSENPMLHTNITAVCFIERELLQIEVLHCGNRNVRRLFASVTLTLTRWPSCTNLTRILSRYMGCAKLRQSFRKLSFYRLQT